MKKERFITIEDNLKLWVETYGKASDEACMFISGAGANSTFWSERICKELSENGFFVIKYDHRDFGYSTKINFEDQSYDMRQLAEDALIILDSLGIDKAHLVGHSMGGFIVQLLTIHFPDKVSSITSISSSTNSPDIPPPPRRTWEIFMATKPTNNFSKDLQGFMSVWRYLNGTASFDEDLAIEYTRDLYYRQEIDGALGESHVKAQASLSDRSEQLKKLKIPALIMHGEKDYLVDKYGGIQTADCIDNSELVLIPKMGHLPFNYQILEAFENHIIEFLLKNKKK